MVGPKTLIRFASTPCFDDVLPPFPREWMIKWVPEIHWGICSKDDCLRLQEIPQSACVFFFFLWVWCLICSKKQNWAVDSFWNIHWPTPLNLVQFAPQEVQMDSLIFHWSQNWVPSQLIVSNEQWTLCKQLRQRLNKTLAPSPSLQHCICHWWGRSCKWIHWFSTDLRIECHHNWLCQMNNEPCANNCDNGSTKHLHQVLLCSTSSVTGKGQIWCSIAPIVVHRFDTWLHFTLQCHRSLFPPSLLGLMCKLPCSCQWQKMGSF